MSVEESKEEGLCFQRTWNPILVFPVSAQWKSASPGVILDLSLCRYLYHIWEGLCFWKCSWKESFASFYLHGLAWLQIFLFVFFSNTVIGFTVDYKGKIKAASAHLPHSPSRMQFIICKAHLFLNYFISERLSSLQWYFLISWNVSSWRNGITSLVL